MRQASCQMILAQFLLSLSLISVPHGTTVMDMALVALRYSKGERASSLTIVQSSGGRPEIWVLGS